MLGLYLKLSHDSFLPRLFQLFMNHPIIRRNMATVADAATKEETLNKININRQTVD